MSDEATAATAADGLRPSFCRICEAFCGLQVDVRAGRAVKLLPDRDNPHSRGHVCIKGTSFLDIVYDEDRVTKPLRRDRRSGRFEAVSWDVVLDEIADRLAAILREHGTEALANYTGNPSAFSVGATLSIRPWFSHFGAWKMFAAATQDVSSRMLASFLLYGSALRLPIPDLPRCDLLIALGANMLVSHGSLLTAPRLREDLDAIAERGKVIIVDPRRTETAARYDHLFVSPDSDAWLLAAMLATIFEEGLAADAVLEARTLEWSALRDAVGVVSPERASVRCGIDPETIRTLARDFAATPRAAIYGRTGTCRGSHSTLVNLFICALNIVAGKFGVEGGWTFGDAAVDMAATRPGGYEVRDTRLGSMAYVGKNLPFSQLASEILTPGEGRVRALFVESGNILLSAPGSDRTAEALEALELFVSVDLYVNDTNRHADYILPGTTFLEREDVPMFGFPHMIRPYAQHSPAAIAPVGEAREDHNIFEDLGQRLHDRLVEAPGQSGYGRPSPPAFRPMQALDTLFRQSDAQVAGDDGDSFPLTMDFLRRFPHGVMLRDGLSCSTSWDKILHPDGRIRLWHPMLDDEMARLLATPPRADDELLLFSRRDLRSINSWMHNSDRLVRSQAPRLLLHPADAARRGIGDGDMVTLASREASVNVPVTVSDDVVAGSVCYPHGWGHAGGWQRANAAPGININRLAPSAAGEPISASSLLDGIRVTVALAEA